MLYEPPRDPCLSEAQHRQLIEIEQHMRVSDPVLENSLRTVRLPTRAVDHTQAGMIAFIASPLIILASILLGVGVGAIVALLTIIVAQLWFWCGRSRHTSATRTPRQPS